MMDGLVTENLQITILQNFALILAVTSSLTSKLFGTTNNLQIDQTLTGILSAQPCICGVAGSEWVHPSPLG